MPHRKLSDIIANQELVCVSPSDMVSDTAERMQGNHVGSVLVIEDGDLKGIFTGSNMLNGVIKAGRDAAKTQVGDVMTPNPVCLTHDDYGIECVRVMRENNIRHVVVHNPADGTYGIVSVRDFPNEEICEFDAELEFEKNLWEHI